MLTLKMILLRPIGKLYDLVYRIRRFAYKYNLLPNYSFQVPVVSVGNLSFGGTGKTPTTIWMANTFVEEGLVPLVLTRGYKSQVEKSSGILNCNERLKSNPAKFGDEPTLIAKCLRGGSVVVGANRVRNLRKYFFEVLPDIVILDDGFQHLKMRRNFNLVLVDSTIPLEEIHVPPIGKLREGPSSLKDADAVVYSKVDLSTPEHIQSIQDRLRPFMGADVLTGKMKYTTLGLFNFREVMVHSCDELDGMECLIASAIANPKGFRSQVENLGMKVAREVRFSDHHDFTEEDIQKILLEAQQLGLRIVVTEKDFVKLRHMVSDFRFMYLKVEVEFVEGADEILGAIREKVLCLD